MRYRATETVIVYWQDCSLLLSVAHPHLALTDFEPLNVLCIHKQNLLSDAMHEARWRDPHSGGQLIHCTHPTPHTWQG